MTDSISLPLDAQTVANPAQSRLAMRFDPHGLHIVITSKIEDNSLIWRYFPLDSAATSTIKALQDTIYENSALIADFASIDILIDTPRFLLIPSEKSNDADTVSNFFRQLYPDTELETIINPLTPEASLAMGVDPELPRFLRRTFTNPRISHRLTPLIRYFGARNQLGNTGKLHAHLNDDSVDVIAFGHEGLLMANTFHAPQTSDALYYILEAASFLNFDNKSDQILLSGSQARRELMLPLLRKYITYVMPDIFPSNLFRAGKNSLLVPFELIAIPMCD